MDLMPPSPPPDMLDDMNAAEIEIPEPDYDDSDDDVNEPASGFYDNEADEVSAPDTCTQRVDDEYRADDDAGQVDVDQVDDGVGDSYDFDGVRSKLEAFSVEQHRLRGSVSTADQDVDIPEPDYSDYSDDDQLADVLVDDEMQSQLISPKKLVNPCLESKEHKALRRELALNQKLGINVLDNKTELRKEMDKRKQRQQRRDDEQQQRQNRSTFELRLEQQANKLDSADRHLASGERKTTDVSPASTDDRQPTSEFLRLHAKISQSKSAS